MTNINKHGIIYRGSNPVTDTSKDTVSTWANFGPGIWMFDKNGKVNGKPSDYAILLSLCQKGTTEIHQIWFVQPSGNVYHRGGNASGWSGTWKLFSPGTANAAQVLTGYTFSSANGSNISGTMKNYSNSIQTGTTATNDQTKSCYRINNGYIEVVPAIGYWGLWDWSRSCIKIPVSTAASTQIRFSGQTVVTQTDDGTSTGSYATPNYVNMSLFNTITIGVNLHGGKDAYGSGGTGTVTCQVKNASGTILAQESKTGSKTENNAFNGNFTVNVSSLSGSAKIYCTLTASGSHAWKPNNNGKSKYTGHAEITSIKLS